MNFFNQIRENVLSIVEELSASGALPPGLDTAGVAVEPPRDPAHGDVATNAALALARQAGRKPREIAGLIAPRLAADEAVAAVEVAGPGFINLRLADAFWHARLADVLAAGKDYGASDMGGGRAVNIEYVSTNPTGPLHVGHARGAVFGDALAALLEKVGYAVTREYYINDAGAQVDALVESTARRYGEALGVVSGGAFDLQYPGEYLKDIGRKLADEFGAKWVGEGEGPGQEIRFMVDDADLIERTLEEMMGLIRADLAALGVRHEVFSSERALVDSGRVQHALDLLESKGLVYTGVLERPKGKVPDDWEARPQTLFRSTEFGDDVDRPLKKSDGSWTYFATDIAYHLDKVERGCNILIDVWGADHGGYVKRMKAAVAALTDGEAELDVKLCQLVKLLRRGEPVKMSKRAGDFVALRDVIDEVGRDVVRFIMLTRRNDAPLDFDLARVTEQSRDNPVFYVQYAHARACSVMRRAGDEIPALDTGPGALAGADLGRLSDSAELGLIKLLASWPRQVESAAEAHEPHRLAFYLHDLAAAFHGLWNKGKEEPGLRFIVADDGGLTQARLALVQAVRAVIASGLGIFGVEPVEKMR